MKVLFITSSRIGDAVLSTGLLDYIGQTWPQAKVTIVCGGLPASLFEGYPQRERTITMKKQSWNRHWISLWKQVIGRRWDIVVDLRDSAVSRLIFADKRYVFGSHIDKSLHKVAQAAAVMKLGEVPAPRLWFTAAQKEKAAALIPDGGPVLGIGPTANWAGKTWPVENFIALAESLTAPDGILPGARVAVFAAPGEEEAARTLLHTFPPGRQIDVIAKTDPGTAAACLARCDLYIGNDSGLMHCAAASGTPTIGLFGPSWPHLYRPWGEHCAYAQTPRNFDQLIDFPEYDVKTVGSLMTSLSLQKVLEITQQFWTKKDH